MSPNTWTLERISAYMKEYIVIPRSAIQKTENGSIKSPRLGGSRGYVCVGVCVTSQDIRKPQGQKKENKTK